MHVRWISERVEFIVIVYWKSIVKSVKTLLIANLIDYPMQIRVQWKLKILETVKNVAKSSKQIFLIGEVTAKNSMSLCFGYIVININSSRITYSITTMHIERRERDKNSIENEKWNNRRKKNILPRENVSDPRMRRGKRRAREK